MDRKQPLILILAVALFGGAIAAAIWVFSEKNVRVRRDAIVTECLRIAADARQYRLRPATLGGGGGAYRGYVLPAALRSTGYARYEAVPDSAGDTLRLSATAAGRLGTIDAVVGPEGSLTIVRITGELNDEEMPPESP